MKQQTPRYTTSKMTKEAFFYAYKQLAHEDDEHLLLESGRSGNLCMAGLHPLAVLRADENEHLRIEWRDGTIEVREGEPLEQLTQFVEAYQVDFLPELPEFQGGIAGFISYDYVRRYEELPIIAENDLHTPDLFFYLFDEWAVLDLTTETVYFITLPESGINPEDVQAKWLDAVSGGLAMRRFAPSVAVEMNEDGKNLDVSLTGPQFEEMVREVQQHIENEEVVQVNLTVRQSKLITAEPLVMYEALRSFNPSPYMASIGAKEFAIISGSPEMLMKKRGKELSTRPIGGTRPRGMNDAEEATYEAALLSSKKDIDEHIMLVDVEREDFEQICAPKTVETNEFMVVEKYSHVMHLVSNIRGTAAEGISNADIVKGVFPGGTITGSPKLRTMEIIEELEPQRRGVYTGSIGWFGFNGDFELNIVIRTAFIRNNQVYIQAGAGLVADSVPEAEYIESLGKAKALWQAKAMAEGKR